MLLAIWAMDENRLIGRQRRLPWSLPAELAHFHRTIAGYPILVGRITFAGLPLTMCQNRTIMVASRNNKLRYDDRPGQISVVTDLQNTIAQYRQHPTHHLYVIGGRQIYQYLWAYFDQLVVSYVRGQFTGDVYFPAVDWHQFAPAQVVPHPEFKVVYYQRR